jgi:hypothetical protein
VAEGQGQRAARRTMLLPPMVDSSPPSAATGNSSNSSTPTLRCRTKPLLQPAAKSAPVTLPSVPAPTRKHHHRMSLLQVLSAPASPRSPSRFDWGGDRLLCFFQPRRKGGGRKERERAGEERG